MDTSSSMRGLARRLLADQTTSGSIHEVAVVSERLRMSLTEFAGVEGFASLLRRALLLASEEVPSLQTIKVGADGHMEGMDKLVAENGTGAEGGEAAVALASHFLGLLVTFIGEPLTLKLVHEAWVDTSRRKKRSTTETDR